MRRHCKSLGHPIIGDANYGRGEHNRFLASHIGLERLALHALAVTLAHPSTGDLCTWKAPLSEDLRVPFGALGFDCDRAIETAFNGHSIQPNDPETMTRERETMLLGPDDEILPPIATRYRKPL